MLHNQGAMTGVCDFRIFVSILFFNIEDRFQLRHENAISNIPFKDAF